MTSIFDLEHQHQDIDSKIAAALERLSQVFRVLLWEKTKSHQLSPIQIQILVHLLYHSHEDIMIGQIAAQFSLTAATVSDAVKTLFQKGLVVRTSPAADRRSTSVSLTTAGEQLARKLALWANIVRDNISEFDQEDKLVVMRFLMRLIETLQRAGLITVARMCITCRFFETNPKPDPQQPHYCKLMERPLANAALRLDCPEHELRIEDVAPA